jgi:hypothetical protein
MKRAAFFLILLLLWAQVDDACALGFVLPSVPLADDDEYLPAERLGSVKVPAPQERREFVVLNAHRSVFSSPACHKKPADAVFNEAFARSSLFVFMSLRW